MTCDLFDRNSCIVMLCVYAGCHGNNISSIGDGAMFAAAEDFSHLIDDDIASSPGDMIGTGAVSRRDNAGNLTVSVHYLSDYSPFAAFTLFTVEMIFNHHHPPQPFYGPFSGTTRVTRCQKRTSGLYGARED